MPRYDKDHKQATRQRIIEAAGRRFKQDGFDGSGIATLMADAGLTNGAFYAHFESKDDLVANVVDAELRRQADRFRALEPGRAGLATLVDEYLSPQHRDNRATGCPSAALLDEMSRCGEQVKATYTDGAKAIVDEIAHRLDPKNSAGARRTALTLFALLVGTMQLARAVADRTFSDQILAQGRRAAGELIML